MAKYGPFSWQTTEARSVTVDGRTLTPIAQVVRLDAKYFGWVWNRPFAVRVEEAGAVRVLPVPDPTRWMVLLFAALAVMVAAGRRP